MAKRIISYHDTMLPVNPRVWGSAEDLWGDEGGRPCPAPCGESLVWPTGVSPAGSRIGRPPGAFGQGAQDSSPTGAETHIWEGLL